MPAGPRSRHELAEALLAEAVYRSRAKQAALGSVQAAAAAPGAPQCGLGREAAVELGLGERGAALLRELWPPDGRGGSGSSGPDPARLQGALAAWVARQDQLDRERNHFLKAFRQRHGFDRRAYAPEVLAAYEAGLAEVNARARSELEAAAAALLA